LATAFYVSDLKKNNSMDWAFFTNNNRMDGGCYLKIFSIIKSVYCFLGGYYVKKIDRSTDIFLLC